MGNSSDRRISVRQRILHPSAISAIDLAACSSSDPGRSGYLSPYNEMKSMYFDESLYENKMHYHINNLLNELNEMEEDPDREVLYIDAPDEETYNKMLDKLYLYSDGKMQFSGETGDDVDVVVEKDVRENYRQFNEDNFLVNKEENK